MTGGLGDGVGLYFQCGVGGSPGGLGGGRGPEASKDRKVLLTGLETKYIETRIKNAKHTRRVLTTLRGLRMRLMAIFAWCMR